ncbi:MAG: hypothetical protein WCF85_20535 [Rhodospirillaceae bacterium]
MGQLDVMGQGVGAIKAIKLNGHDVLVNATSCGEIDMGSVEVHVRLSDRKHQDTYDIGVCVFCQGIGCRLNLLSLSDTDKVALNSLSRQVEMDANELLLHLISLSNTVCENCISASAGLLVIM